MPQVSQKYACRDKIFLSQPNVCRDKHTFVATKDVLSRQTRRKSKLVATKLCLSRQLFCRDKHTFVATKHLLSRQNLYLLPFSVQRHSSLGALCEASFSPSPFSFQRKMESVRTRRTLTAGTTVASSSATTITNVAVMTSAARTLAVGQCAWTLTSQPGVSGRVAV